MTEIMYRGISDEELKWLKAQGKCGVVETERCYWRRDRLCYYSKHCKDKLPLDEKKK